MYNIHLDQQSNILSVDNIEKTVEAKIHLNQGASLQYLKLKSHAIIQYLAPLSYSNTYASSILFPFANRIEDGVYKFENEIFEFEKNLENEKNALHGLVFDKMFQLVCKEATENFAKVTLEYIENNPPKSFPFEYKIQLHYTFKKANCFLKMEVTNLSEKAFPFTLGWHPYFTSANLYTSEVVFSSNEKMVLNDRNITTGVTNSGNTKPLKLEGKQFDDCWKLEHDEVNFNTPEYILNLNATSNSTNFLQIYTPPKNNTIAIEPTTGVSNSFNNKIGLETLASNKTYAITWNLNVTDKNNNEHEIS